MSHSVEVWGLGKQWFSLEPDNENSVWKRRQQEESWQQHSGDWFITQHRWNQHTGSHGYRVFPEMLHYLDIYSHAFVFVTASEAWVKPLHHLSGEAQVLVSELGLLRNIYHHSWDILRHTVDADTVAITNMHNSFCLVALELLRSVVAFLKKKNKENAGVHQRFAEGRVCKRLHCIWPSILFSRFALDAQ